MPANIAHILIANAALNSIQSGFPELADQIRYKNNFFYLGAIGPDLPSYKTSELVHAALISLLVRPFVSELNPREQDASFFLHSTRPHLFPYYLMETNLSFCDVKNGTLIPNEFNLAVYVFALGYMCHIAADQVVHQLVRELVGPYYRSLQVSRAHSDCEVHQDIFLFKTLFPDRRYERTIQSAQIDISQPPFANDYDSFCNLISLAISKAGYGMIDKSDIDGWLDGIQTTFRLMYEIGPYVSVMKSVAQLKDPARHPNHARYFKNDAFDYMDYFNRAVALSCKYLEAVRDLWNAPEFSNDVFVEYQKKVLPYDLTSPYFRIVSG